VTNLSSKDYIDNLDELCKKTAYFYSIRCIGLRSRISQSFNISQEAITIHYTHGYAFRKGHARQKIPFSRRNANSTCLDINSPIVLNTKGWTMLRLNFHVVYASSWQKNFFNLLSLNQIFNYNEKRRNLSNFFNNTKSISQIDWEMRSQINSKSVIFQYS